MILRALLPVSLPFCARGELSSYNITHTYFMWGPRKYSFERVHELSVPITQEYGETMHPN